MEEMALKIKTEVGKYINNQNHLDSIYKALEFAQKKYQNQLLLEKINLFDYIASVVLSLANYQSEPLTIISTLLFKADSKDEDYIVKEFGESVKIMLDSLRKIDNVKKLTNYEIDNENFRKIFVALANDYRVIVLRLAMQEELMNRLSVFDENFQKVIAKETLDVYTPLAHRLGMFRLKSNLENMSLYYLEKEKYLYIQSKLKQKEDERMNAVESMRAQLAKLLNDNKIEFYSIKGRPKQIYSIYNKMEKKNLEFEQLYDLLALRVITKTEVNCYEVLGYVHTVYKPISGKFKDYIAVPKPNMYQSLHTSVIGSDGNIYEIQIRTKEMDEIAESGVAAHWKYKEGSKVSSEKLIEEHLHWFKDYVSVNEVSVDSNEYVENLKKDIFEANIYVMSPKGKVIDLPKGSCPLDFAYRIHSKVGHSCVGALVNGIMVPLNTVLKTGDVIEIKTSKIHTLPSEGWLQFVKTNFAKNTIRKALLKKDNVDNRELMINKGMELLNEQIKDKQVNEKEAETILNSNAFLKQFAVSKIEELYIGIASRSISPLNVTEKIKAKLGQITQPVFEFKKKTLNRQSKNGIIVQGAEDVKVTISQCCSPIPGDEIVGFISRGNGVRVHRKDCPTIKKETPRLIDVTWDDEVITNILHQVDIIIRAGDRPNLLIEIMNSLSTQKITVLQVNAVSHKETLTASFHLSIMVKNGAHFNEVANSLKNISGIYQLERVTRN